MGLRKDMTGIRFQKLIVIEAAGKEAQGQMKWLCKCDCGNISIATGRNLRNGHTRSCGCYRAEKNTKHAQGGRNKTPEYMAWDSMIQRCRNSNSAVYKRYGGRGIKVCERWENFELFFEDMGKRPSNAYSLDRYPNNNGDYAPDNCRWATTEQQTRNKENNIWIEHNGENMILQDWAKRTGINYNTIKSRLKKGVSIKDALTIIPIKGEKTKLKYDKNRTNTGLYR